MKTLVFKLDISDEERGVISSLQKDYSISFRRTYSNMELMKDKNFLESLRIKSKKQIEYLQKEVLAFHERNIANKEEIQGHINKLSKEPKLKLKDFRRLQRLKKSLTSNVCFGGRNNLVKLSKNKGNKEEWKESRLLPLVFYGETSRNGNRFFDLKNISEGKILFKLECTKIRIPLSFNPKKYKELKALEILAKEKGLSITVKLTSKLLYITYDEAVLHNTKLDIKAFYGKIKDVIDKKKRKELIADRHREHEDYLKRGKVDRYLGIDLNPDGIGYSIMDKKFNIIDKGYIDISRNIKTDKRRYETSIMIKEIFKLIKHYRCHTIVLEELKLKEKDLGNRVSNRKVNNLWNRELIEQIITRRCNETGTIKIEVNPVYTTFIGNVMHNEYDPVAASMEICRRGILKYSKGGFYPELNVTNFINDKRYDEIKGCSTWKDLYALFVTSRWSYRRELKEFNFSEYYIGNRKSRLKWVHFQ